MTTRELLPQGAEPVLRGHVTSLPCEILELILPFSTVKPISHAGWEHIFGSLHKYGVIKVRPFGPSDA